MINKESIISSFDDKPTLLEWLKKVEAALKGASASSFKVNKKGDATLTFSIVFDDGSEIESDAITLQQGESVESAAIVNGHLILTLTNGEQLDAGALFNGNVNINGNFTANSIIENMTGYSFTNNEVANVTKTTIYAGAVKNGNKLTLVVFMKINLATEYTSDYLSLGQFNIPTEIGARIYPTRINNVDLLDARNLTAVISAEANTTIRGYLAKGRGIIYFETNDVKALAKETDYFIRYEITFLLSDNLAQ